MDFILLLIGMWVGAFVGFTVFACLQIAKTSDLEDEIHRLREQLKNK